MRISRFRFKDLRFSRFSRFQDFRNGDCRGVWSLRLKLGGLEFWYLEIRRLQDFAYKISQL